MRVEYSKLRELERRFAHLNRSELGESIIYRTRGGRELFRLESNGRRLRLPVSFEIIQSLFGEVPFRVEPYGDSCVVNLDSLGDEVLLWTLLEALGEQSVDTTDEVRRTNAVDVIEKSMNEISPSGGAIRKRPVDLKESEIAGSTRHLPVQFLLRVAVAGVVLLLAAFLSLSFMLGSRAANDDREISVEELLRR